jgi:protein subunit release factor B
MIVKTLSIKSMIKLGASVRISRTILATIEATSRLGQLSRLFSSQPSKGTEFDNTVPRKRIDIVIHNKDLEWKYVRGSGPGGQAANKTSNCVIMTHKPSGITVRAEESRETETNKHYAIKKLKERLDILTNGNLSKKQQEIDKIRSKKARRARRRQSAEGSENKPNPDGKPN